MSRRMASLLLVLLATALCAFVPAAQADFLSTDGGNAYSAAAHQVDDPTAGDEVSDDTAGNDDDANEAEGVTGYEDEIADDDAYDDPAPGATAKHKAKHGKKARPARRGRKPAKAKSKAKAQPKHKSAKRR